MANLKIPRIFEVGLVLFLVLAWLVNLTVEKTSVGKWVAGYNFELYPLSSFSVYLWPKTGGASFYSFEVLETPDSKPVSLDGFDMFYPLAAPNLDDEIAYKQLEAIEKSYRQGCSQLKMHCHQTCVKEPGKSLEIPADIAAMWLRSIAHHTGIRQTPHEVRFVRTYFKFHPDTYQTESTTQHRLMRFYPQKDWVAHAP